MSHDKATRLYERFTGHNGDQAIKVKVKTTPKTLTAIGPCVGIAYEATRDGITERYFHEFADGAAPLLCSSPDGSQLFLIGGNYEFRDTGINDLDQ